MSDIPCSPKTTFTHFSHDCKAIEKTLQNHRENISASESWRMVKNHREAEHTQQRFTYLLCVWLIFQKTSPELSPVTVIWSSLVKMSSWQHQSNQRFSRQHKLWTFVISSSLDFQWRQTDHVIHTWTRKFYSLSSTRTDAEENAQ